ncbi:MAG: glucose-1-phosphate thymidylyltransferase RfbA [Bacilli bacterium]|nr:glucose-1-phosphate thymidylyltransferase RfbA [Bacilli bacterium]
MKGIILAGGSGTRLYPITQAISKQVMPIYDKPMIYYPLSVLMMAGIKDIMVITTKEDQPNFIKLLKDGSQFGINIEYKIQPSPDGLAQAFILGEEFIGNDPCAMVLGDNIYFGNNFKNMLVNAKEYAENGKASIFGYQVRDPQRFGIMEIDENQNVLSVEEKPQNPKSDYAITGLYFYPKGVSEMAKQVKPSKRGELEITTLNDMYLKNGNLRAELLGGGFTWFDTGTIDSMMEANSMIRLVQTNNGKIISCPEAIAYNQGWIDKDTLLEAATLMQKNDYGKYLFKVAEKNKSLKLEK